MNDNLLMYSAEYQPGEQLVTPAEPSGPPVLPAERTRTRNLPSRRIDRSFDRLPRPGDLHLPSGPDPVAAAVILTLCLAALFGAAMLFVLLHSLFS